MSVRSREQPREPPEGRLRRRSREASAELGRRIRRTPTEVRQRAKPVARSRFRDVRMAVGLAAQAGVAAALAWVGSHELLGNPDPVFAPIVAVGSLAASAGQRLRSLIELIFGIAVGIAVGDFLIFLIGTGPWQLALVVALSVVAPVAVGASASVVTQSAATSVLIVTLSPSVSNIETPRVVDALVGGAAVLLVSMLLLPLDPMRLVKHEADPLLDELARQLHKVGDSLGAGNAGTAAEALQRLRKLQDNLPAMHHAIDAGRETAHLSPFRWRRRATLKRYVASGEHLHRVTHNSGALARRTVTMIEDREPVPPALPDAIRWLAKAVQVLHHELSGGEEPEASRAWTQRACAEAGRAYEAGVGLSGSVVVAQIRTISSDLLRASGLDQPGDDPNKLVREAVAAGRARWHEEQGEQGPRQSEGGTRP